MTAVKPVRPNDTLKVRRVAIDTYRENVAYLHRECDFYRAEGFQALTKMEIKASGCTIYAVLNVVGDARLVGTDELGLSEQAFAQLNMTEGDPVRVAQAERPASMEAGRRKIVSERLSQDDFRAITRDITDNRYSKMEMAAFLVASGQTGLDREKILYLTRAMTESGQRLDWHEPLVVDKHCIGGIPVGPTAKVRHMREALQLRKLFEYIGDRMGIHLEVIITDGAQPVGRGFGPVLESRDVLQVLRGQKEAPADLRQSTAAGRPHSGVRSGRARRLRLRHRPRHPRFRACPSQDGGHHRGPGGRRRRMSAGRTGF